MNQIVKNKITIWSLVWNDSKPTHLST